MSKRTVFILSSIFLLGAGFLLFLNSEIRTITHVLAAAKRLPPSAAKFPNATASRATPTPLNVSIKEWDVPTKGAHPHDPAVAPDGSLWFTEQLQNKLGRLDPVSGTFKEYVLTIPDSGPHGLVADSEGNIWFTGNGKAYIGKLDPKNGTVTVHKMPDPKAEDPHTGVFDANDVMWFTVQVGNMVGRLDPRTGTIDLKTMAAPDSRPENCHPA